MSSPDAAGGAALARCTACGVDVFVEQYWGLAPLLTRAVELPADFADLLDAAAVDELVSAHGLRTPFLRMAKDGTVLAASRFTRGGGAGAAIADQVADDKVLAQLAGGATLVLQALHRTWPPVVDFATRLSAELGHPVQVNAYITPPQNRGFAPHYDVHDVFVLQVSGRKQWRLHEPVLLDPLEEQNWEKHRDAVAARAAEPPLIDAIVEPGDALYLPRGTIHSAAALGETSIHLTVGVHPLTRYDVVRELLDDAITDPALRHSLPAGVDLSDPDTLAPQLTATVDALRAHLDAISPAAVAARIGVRLRHSTRPEPIGPLGQLALLDRLGPASLLRLRTGLHPRVEHHADEIVLGTFDQTVRLAAAAGEAVKIILSGAPFQVGDLAGLDRDGQLELARRLVYAAIVVPG
jgi:hypothetical protein